MPKSGLYLKSSPLWFKNSFLASEIAFGSSINCIPVKASVFAATIIPFIPMLVPPAATACQLCAELPGTHVAALKPTVGTVKLTSPTSVEPPAFPIGL